jgi:hypothetical protein
MFSLASFLSKLHGYPFHPFPLVVMLLLKSSFLFSIDFALLFLAPFLFSSSSQKHKIRTSFLSSSNSSKHK